MPDNQPRIIKAPPSQFDRAIGAFVGLAIGDALGASVEFMPRGTFIPVTDMRGGGRFGLPPGGFTDDTSMSLALADALIEDRALATPASVMDRWAAFMGEGRYSHTGTCFDIGHQTSRALSDWQIHKRPPEKETKDAGNGGIMRLVPAVIANLHDLETAKRVAVRQSSLTHRNHECEVIAAQMAEVLYRLINGEEYAFVPPTICSRPAFDVRATGYVVDTYEAALWACAPRDGFREIILRAVNLGGDADTVGAVTGQIAGAMYGFSSIPEEWISKLLWKDEIVRLGKLLVLGKEPDDQTASLAPSNNGTSRFVFIKRMFGLR